MAEEDIIYLTKDGYETLRSELTSLKHKLFGEIAQRISEAREYGDITENSEYEEAKNEQARVEARIREIESVLSNAEIIERVEGNIGEIGIGSNVIVQDQETNEILKLTIVTHQEADIEANKISDLSPLGKALMGKIEGETVRIKSPSGGFIFYRILGVNRV